MTAFDIDKQTLNDLEVFGSSEDHKSLFDLFNQTCTIEGESTLKLIFKNPLTDIKVITERLKLIQYLQNSSLDFNLDKESVDFIAFYIRQNNRPKKPSALSKIKKTVSEYLNPTRAFYIKRRGVKEVLDLITYLDLIVSHLNRKTNFSFLKKINDVIIEIKNNRPIAEYLLSKNNKLTPSKLSVFDFEIRTTAASQITNLLTLLYELDAYFAVAKTAKQHTLCYPQLNSDEEKHVEIKMLRHIFLDKPVPNDVFISTDKNVSFITGVNMAGKSTLLKSIAIAVYLAHLGFPVPAQQMKTSVFHGLMTTINISDSLSQGYSHFYNEVRRVSSVASKIDACKNMFVIFDELFRGTNVKDAHEASVSIINAFSKIKNCFFIVSTHIVEVAEDLHQNENIDFNFLETKMIGNKPSYSHKLKAGITSDRMGLWIIKNEGILNILDRNAKR
ncbi:DNA mismatch repair protein [Pedobacter yonginense]|uniref:DNA mismatch repair protein n=1 Tax=Pedobacter yonginense TaxID=651869 RepID=A0A317EK61_9SPHI|nr:DNA mismatch repair protein [Pedobacter yonginense]PWS26974.1 DNA mismatch repair protein [Pedobacter yonginense]